MKKNNLLTKTNIMKEELYYTVSPHLENIDGIYETDGNQTITVYSILMDVPKIRYQFATTIEGDDRDKIEATLIDYGYDPDDFDLIPL